MIRLSLPDRVEIFASADILAVIVSGKSEDDLDIRDNAALAGVSTYLNEHGLELSPNKCELTTLTSRK